MYAHMVHYHPIVGRAFELREVVLRRAQELRELGVKASVAQSVWSEDFPGVRLTQEFESLAEFEDSRNLDPKAARAFIEASDLLIRKPVSPSLFEVVSQTGDPNQPAKWLHELTVSSALGKAGELRALMNDRDKSLDSQGRRSSLAAKMAPGDYGLLVRTFMYPSLAALDDQRHRNASSADERQHVEREQMLVGRKTQSEFWEIVTE